MVTLGTRRLGFRPPAEDDIDVLTEMLADPEVARWWPDFDRPRVAIELVGSDDDVRVIENVGEGAQVTYRKIGECEHGVDLHEAVRPSGEVIGVIQSYEVTDPQYRHAGIDLFIGRRHWGQGFGREAVEALVRELFFTRDHHRLVIDPAADNLRAIRLYEAVGFRKVGVMREYERGPDGVFRDGVLLELLRSDYEA